jgi:hypothetical protein
LSEETARRHIEEEFHFDLGDARRNKRAIKVMTRLLAAPGESYNQAHGSWAPTKAAFRLVSNKHMTPEALLAAHLPALLDRCRDRDEVLAIGDTTEFAFNTRHNAEGLGPLSNGKYSRGFFGHVTYVVAPDRTPLGILANQFIVRPWVERGRKHGQLYNKVPLEERESQKWPNSLDAAGRLRENLGPDGPRIVVVFDREGDIGRVLEKAREHREEYALLVRAVQKRKRADVEGKPKVFAHLASLPAQGVFEVEVPASPKRKARRALLEIRYAPVLLNPPRVRAPGPKPKPVKIDVNAILVTEPNPPEGQDPIHWQLYTTLPVTTLDEAIACVQRYTVRWQIEVLFRTLKTVCRAEARQFETAKRLQVTITADLIIASILLRLTHLNRTCPNEPCTEVLSTEQWQALWIYTVQSKPPECPPTIAAAILMLAKLGGYLARKHDRPPGPLCIARGLLRLDIIMQTMRAMQNVRL